MTSTESSNLTFKELRAESVAHLNRHAPNADHTAGAWGEPAPVIGDMEVPIPPELINMFVHVPSAQLAPMLAEFVRMIDRLAAAKNIDLAGAILERLRAGGALEIGALETPSDLKSPLQIQVEKLGFDWDKLTKQE